jgi:hypothetical protein
MRYTIEYFSKGSLESDDGIIKTESELESLLLKLDAEKYVSIVFFHSTSHILTVSGGRQNYIIMFSDNNRFYELNMPENKGREPVILRTGHNVGKFPSEMVIDPFTTLNIMKEFFQTGRKLENLNWKPLI